MDAAVWEPILASSNVVTEVDVNLVAIGLPDTGYLPPRSLTSTQATVLAQQFDQDILGDMGNAWNAFIESGQVWALIIGLVVGYMIRGLTAY